jgi:hypothetical protein
MRPRKTAKTPTHFLIFRDKDTAMLAFGLRRLLVTTFPV